MTGRSVTLLSCPRGYPHVARTEGFEVDWLSLMQVETDFGSIQLRRIGI